MKKYLVFALLILAALIPESVKAGPEGCGGDRLPAFTPFAFESITVSSTSVGLTATTFAPTGAEPAFYATCTAETDSVRHRSDGLAPTATVGQLVYVTATAPASFSICGEKTLRDIRFIRVTADATLQCSYFRRGER